jgi:hypothetical protein
MQQPGSYGKLSLLSNPAFLSGAVAVLILGSILDLLGTYIAQPHFENESNPIHSFLTRRGIDLGWPGAFLGKALYCIVFAYALRLFLIQRNALYPARGANFREFITHFF